jgi:N-acetylmuramoyl-L-alanine amidase
MAGPNNNYLPYKMIPCKKSAYTKFTGAGNRIVESVILHSTDGHKDGDITTLTGNTDRPVSVHWYVTKTGDLYHFVDNNDIAWHAGKVSDAMYSNEHSIGVEQEHLDGEETWTDAQLLTVARLCAAFRQRYGSGLPIKSHAEVATPKGRKEDPKDFPWDKFSALVQANMGTRWTLFLVSNG